MAIFGGSFDPPHIGHETIAIEAIRKLDIALLIIVPAYLSPFKVKSFLNAKTRFKLLKKLFKKNTQIKVSKYEIKQNRSVCSIETIKHIMKKYEPTKLYLIIGADNYKNFHLWENFKEIKKLATLVVVKREGFLYETNSNIKHLKIDIKISSTELRNTFKLEFIPMKIRENIEKIWIKKGKIE